MYTKEKDSFVSSNGVDTVACWSYVPERDPKAIVQIAHGMSEHSGRYHAFAEFLVENDILVCANDHLGHGIADATPEDSGIRQGQRCSHARPLFFDKKDRKEVR